MVVIKLIILIEGEILMTLMITSNKKKYLVFILYLVFNIYVNT